MELIVITRLSAFPIVIGITLLSSSACAGSQPQIHALTAGLYKIDVMVGDANGNRLKTIRQVKRCISSLSIANHTVFHMLSNYPASQCPQYQVCGGEFRTGFVAECPGKDGESALGMFALDTKDFRGRIDVKDANGKVVGTEIQYGDRISDCLDSAFYK